MGFWVTIVVQTKARAESVGKMLSIIQQNFSFVVVKSTEGSPKTISFPLRGDSGAGRDS